VRISSPRGSLTTSVVADASVPEGVVTMILNQDGDASPRTLIDAGALVTEVRLETIA
jgi:hypothetical protein